VVQIRADIDEAVREIRSGRLLVSTQMMCVNPARRRRERPTP
jgi:hypothetical protein